MLNIALDGPSGSGKSTIAKMLSKKLNILYLDTGAMYRACGLKALKSNISPKDYAAVDKFIRDIDLKIEFKNGAQVTVLDGEDVSEEIRRPEMSMAASDISSLKNVRLKMVELQRETAKSTDCVLDGRDIGTFVLPNAKYKFYITADSTERAKRRHKELAAKGFDVELNKLHEEILQRDYNDSHREFAPLCKAKDAVEIDTTNLTAEQVLEKICSFII